MSSTEVKNVQPKSFMSIFFGADESKTKSEKIGRLCIVAMFLVMLIIGLVFFNDYGEGNDAVPERKTARITLNCITETFFGKEFFDDLPPLSEYVDRHYGVFVQMPTTIIEVTANYLFGHTMTDREFFMLQHLWIFLVCWFSYICFYKSLKLMTGNRFFSAFGTVMLFVSPLLFANSFYNMKDSIFLALFTIGIYCILLLLQNRSNKKLAILFGAVCAIAANCRILAVILPAAFVAFVCAEDLLANYLNKKEKDSSPSFGSLSLTLPTLKTVKSTLLTIIIVGASFAVVWFIITPLAWTAPFSTFLDTVFLFSDFNRHHHTAIPWYYVPLNMSLTLPLLQLGLFILGIGSLLVTLVKKGLFGFAEKRYYFLLLGLGAVPWIFSVVKQSCLYNGWRHFFFIATGVYAIAVLGAQTLTVLLKKTKAKQIVAYSLLSLSVLCPALWTAFNHPYEYAYMNPLGCLYVDKIPIDAWYGSTEERAYYAYEGDWWGLSNYELLRQFIATLDESELPVTIYVDHLENGQMLTDEEKTAYILTDSYNEYYISSNLPVVGNRALDSRMVMCIKVDGRIISAVYK